MQIPGLDEAHNATSVLSYEVLQRVNAGCVVEFTATPAEDSNVLHHVSASVLKSGEMIPKSRTGSQRLAITWP